LLSVEIGFGVQHNGVTGGGSSDGTNGRIVEVDEAMRTSKGQTYLQLGETPTS